MSITVTVTFLTAKSGLFSVVSVKTGSGVGAGVGSGVGGGVGVAVAFGVALGSSAVSITSQPAQKTASANAMAKIKDRFIVNTAPLAS